MDSRPQATSTTTALVIGGTGFIGYHIVQQLLTQGFHVRILTRNTARTRNLFPTAVDYCEGELDQLTAEQLQHLMQGCDKLVFAAGADERVEPEGDAWTFFKHANVNSVEKAFSAARQSSITHGVLLSSIFLHLHHQHPELQLAERHPYIRSRVEQHHVSETLANNHFVLTTLEIPWVFGTTPHLPSQWNRLVHYVRSATPLMACRGGMNVVAVQSVAEAVVGALRHPQQSSRQAIGDLNLGYQQLVERLCFYTQRHSPSVRLINERFFHELMQAGGLFRELFNIPAGLDIRHLPELLQRNIHVDNSESQRLLQYTTGIAEQAIQNTVLSLPENHYQKGWRKLLNWISPA